MGALGPVRFVIPHLGLYLKIMILCYPLFFHSILFYFYTTKDGRKSGKTNENPHRIDIQSHWVYAPGGEERKGKHPKPISKVNTLFAINVCQTLTQGSEKYQD